jgi:hypothetical protein
MKTVELYMRNVHIKYTLVIFTKGPVINADHRELSQILRQHILNIYLLDIRKVYEWENMNSRSNDTTGRIQL